MTTWLVTRHQGAIDWVKAQNISFDELVPHLDTEKVQQGDTVIGVLPLKDIATLNAKGARFFALDIEVRFSQRGKELTATDLENSGCHLQEYQVKKI